MFQYDHLRLIVIPVTPLRVDRTVDRLRVIDVHEGAGAVIDCLAGNRGVVCIHHAVDEPDRHPVCHQTGLPADHPVQKVRGVLCVGVVPPHGEIVKRAQPVHVAARREILERADADMA